MRETMDCGGDGGELGLGHLAGKYLTFRLADEVYGLGILTVREIIGLMDITAMPRTPDFVRGVINLRGKIIPVIDLRRKFEMAAVADTPETCIIVVEVSQGAEAVPVGIVVDQVNEVRDVTADQIDVRPQFGGGSETDFILAMGKVAQTVIMLLDIDRVLSAQDLTAFDLAA